MATTRKVNRTPFITATFRGTEQGASPGLPDGRQEEPRETSAHLDTVGGSVLWSPSTCPTRSPCDLTSHFALEARLPYTETLNIPQDYDSVPSPGGRFSSSPSTTESPSQGWSPRASHSECAWTLQGPPLRIRAVTLGHHPAWGRALTSPLSQAH